MRRRAAVPDEGSSEGRDGIAMVTFDDERISFPDAPKAELDAAISELLLTAGRVVSAQGRLRNLLDASLAVVQLTELPAALRRIAEVALDLVDARYAALGVIGADGSLEQFIHVGMSQQDVAAVGHLPEGHGLLGALVDDPRAIRLDRLTEDPRSIGFPPGHPTMESFLGVPIRVRGEVFGNIYVTERSSGAFTDEDQQLLTALAATAGIAIDNARLLEETRRRQRWAQAGAEVTSSLLADETGDALGFIAERVVSLAEADLVSLVLSGQPGTLVVQTSRGPLADSVSGLVFPSEGTLSRRAMESAQPVLADTNEMTDGASNPWIELGPTMAIPLVEAGHLHGVLTVSRARGGTRFTASDVDMAADFAGQASVALALAQAREVKSRLALLEERGRIARDLHDHVIQRLFAAGLGLQSLPADPQDLVLRAGINTAVAALDESIAEIRTAIFALVSPDARERGSLRHRVMDVVAEASPTLSSSPSVVFTGPVDVLVPESLFADVVAVVRESLANVARHADATATSVSILVDDGTIVVEVSDDGRGVSAGSRSSGTSNLQRRATELGGDFSLRNRETGGARLRWSAPLPLRRE
jgi:signal transduction histidine kinase